MDLKAYYQKIRDLESKIAEEFPVVISKETSDGGKGGNFAEVTRPIAAKMVTEGTARLATADESKTYRDAQAQAKQAADQAAEAAKVQLTVVSASELAKLASGRKEKA